MILKNLWGRKMRTLLTLFGIAVGVAAVVALSILAEGFSAGYDALGGGSGADLLVMQDDALDIAFSAVDQALGETLAGFSGVTAVTPMIYTFAATDDAPYFIVYGYEPDGFAIETFKLVEGEPLSRRASGRGGRPVLLGYMAARDLKKSVGDTFRIYESTYRVVGIYETGQPFQDGAAVVLLEDAQTITGRPRQVNAFLLKVRAGTDLDALQQRIEQRFRNVVATQSGDFAENQEMFAYVDAFTWSVSLVAILIGGVGVMNTMLMSVFERTREFGVLRAIGWRPGRVLRMVLGESVVLSLLGGLVGAGIGVGAVRAIANVPTVSAILPPTIAPELILQGLGVALTLGLIGGGLPAWRASRLLPVEAMRADSGTLHASRHVRWAALRSILRQPVRTLLTVIGIGIAMLSIVLMGAMGEGMMDAISGLTMSGGAHLVGSETDASVDLSKIDESAVRRIAALPGVRSAEGFLTGYTMLGDLPFFIVFGYQPRGLMIQDFKIVAGEPLQTGRQILLGRVAAQNLGREVGQTVRIFESSFRVVGIYETGIPLQDGAGIIALRDAQRLFGQSGKVSFMGVWLDDPQQAEDIIALIESRHPEVALSPASEFTENLTDMQMMEGMVWGISLMALVVGGLGMTNTMVMSVFERTREIGVLRALGWRKRRVLGMIVREAVMLSLLGGAVGITAGVALGYGLNLIPEVQGFLEMQYTPALILQAFGTTLALGLIGGIYPAWRAANLQPVEALRYE